MDTRTPRSWLNTTFLLGTLGMALVLVPWKLATHGLRASEVAVFGFLYISTGLAITVGYHRLFSHRAYQAAWPMRLILLLFGAAAFQNSAIAWSSDHRHHHRFVDDIERDPYPVKRGFWYAHWLWVMEGGDRPMEGVADLEQDPLIRWQHKYRFLIGAVMALWLPLLVGRATHNFGGQLIIGLLLRIVLTHHSTFLINSAAHWFGTQPYTDANSARDNLLLAPVTFGEGYHNYHHMWQWDYRNGPRWYHFDPAKWIIAAASWVGLAWGLRRVPETTIQRARVAMEAKRLTAVLDSEHHPGKVALDAAHARLDSALAAFQSRLDAWQALKAEWREKRRTQVEAWRAAQVEWKAQRALLRSELREAWTAWREAQVQVRRMAGA